MIEISAKQRSHNRICGTDQRFNGMRLALMYIHGEMSGEEYAEMYSYANEEGKNAMDFVVLQYLTTTKVGA